MTPEREAEIRERARNEGPTERMSGWDVAAVDRRDLLAALDASRAAHTISEDTLATSQRALDSERSAFALLSRTATRDANELIEVRARLAEVEAERDAANAEALRHAMVSDPDAFAAIRTERDAAEAKAEEWHDLYNAAQDIAQSAERERDEARAQMVGLLEAVQAMGVGALDTPIEMYGDGKRVIFTVSVEALAGVHRALTSTASLAAEVQQRERAIGRAEVVAILRARARGMHDGPRSAALTEIADSLESKP